MTLEQINFINENASKMNFSEMARIIGKHPSTVLGFCRQYGIKSVFDRKAKGAKRVRKKEKKEFDPQVIEMVRQAAEKYKKTA